MNELGRIRLGLKLAHRGPAWHGPSLVKTLNGVTARSAAAHPISGAHSIWEIVRHVTAWVAAATRIIERNEYAGLEGDEDWPRVNDISEAAWTAAIEDLDRAHRELRAAVEKLTVERLDEKIPGREYTWYILLHGVVEHDVYHAGQIAMLKKAAQ